MRNLNVLAISAIIILTMKMPSLAQAQKLPAIQTTSVRAPKDIKIDGKPTEWPRFEAFSNTTDFSYTISNDNKNIYLAVQATYHGTIAKIVANGITFTIKNNDKNSNIIPFAITYPYLLNNPGNVSSTLRKNQTLTESQLSRLNAGITAPIKEIPLTGAKGINDASISIYNEFGIKANGLVDVQKAYTCEIAIPIKYLEQIIDANGKFSYRLQVNGEKASSQSGNAVAVVGYSLNSSAAPINRDYRDSYEYVTSPTHFDGVYTLAK